MVYHFSVGQLTIMQGLSVVKTITNARNINVEYSVTEHLEYNSEGEVTDSVRDTETLTITADWADVGFDLTLAVDQKYDVVLQPSTTGKGIAAITFNNCKLSRYTTRSSQADYVICELGFTKIGPLDNSATVSQRVKFGSIYLGDSATVNTTYEGNVQPLIIPTALGVLVRTTQHLGGGQLSINVTAYAKKPTRLELEQYILNLYISLAVGPETLTVEYGATSYTITNCVFARGTPAGSNKVYGNFSADFLRTAY